MDLIAIDSSGRHTWEHTLETRGILSWSVAPWFGIADASSPSSTGDYVAVPEAWFSTVAGNRTAFAISFGKTAASPGLVNLVQDGSVVAQGEIGGSRRAKGRGWRGVWLPYRLAGGGPA